MMALKIEYPLTFHTGPMWSNVIKALFFDIWSNSLVMAQRYYTLDEFLLKFLPVQRYSGIFYLKFHRENRTGSWQNDSFQSRLLYVCLIITVTEFFGNIIKVAIYIGENQLQEAKQVAAIWSIESLCVARGIFLMLKKRKIIELTNDLDKIFPLNSQLQSKMNCGKLARYLELRYDVLRYYTGVGVLAFIMTPLVQYLLYYDQNSGLPIPDACHQHASWFPFHLKDNPHYYPYMYTWETLITLLAFNCIIAWDHIYTVSVVQLHMHFEFVNSQLAQLNAENSLHLKTSEKIFNRIFGIIQYHQHILRLGDKFRNTFNVPLLITNMISAASVCFHVYLIANTDNLLSIFLFIFPCVVQVAFTYDNCYQGTRIETATSEMSNILFHHNWYEGSLEYQKLIYRMLQSASKPFTLSSYNLFSIDMMHFRSSMSLAYQLFAFLQARGTKN
ncbi:odorant receptor 88a-like [Haematobia irritans]|uniref:odorant receptor 88a-like n=1 Tax=Haematobia irritans TaxID=7368 RepID=UPI003F501629